MSSDENENAKNYAKRIITDEVVDRLMKKYRKNRIDAFELFYGTLTYQFMTDDDKFGVVREGADAIFARLVAELDANFIY